MGKIIGVGGDKGGCGKTTTATNLAALAALRGFNVGLLDADGTKPDSFRWNERRRELAVLPQVRAKRVLGQIDDAIIAMADEHEVLIIDTGGMDSPEMRYAAGYADIFIAPFNTSRYDLDTIQKVSSILVLARVNNPELRAYSLLIGASNHPQSRSTQKARATLQTVGYPPCLDSMLHYLEVWKDTAETGRGVHDYPPNKAQGDLEAVVKEAALW